MLTTDSSLGYLLGEGFSPDAGDPHYPIAKRLGGLKQIGLISVGPTGIGVAVACLQKGEWKYSKSDEFSNQLNFPTIPDKALATLRKVSGKGYVCVSLGFGEPPVLGQMSQRLDDIEEMRTLYHSPQQVISEYEYGEGIATSVVHNANASGSLIVGMQREYIANLQGSLRKSGLKILRLQSTATNLLELAGAAPDVMSGKSHFAIVDHMSVTLVETDEDGKWINVFHDPEAARKQGADLGVFLSGVAEKVPAKPLVLLASSKSQLQSFKFSDSGFEEDPFLGKSGLNGGHLATATLLIK